jgi:ABC-type transport system substrate-binding protein
VAALVAGVAGCSSPAPSASATFPHGDISMNLATPPFDDIHVRRAVAFVLDRKKIEDAFGGAISGTVTGHLAFDSTEDNALVNYDPYRTSDNQARLSVARQEMARSACDSAPHREL